MDVMTVSIRQRDYRSIFLDDGWAHQKYFGWRVIEDRPGLRVLEKQRFVFTRSLMLLTRGGESWLDEAVARSCGRAGLAGVIVHDFDCVLSEPPVLAGHRFHRAGQRERVLNIATYVIDLEEDEETLWKNFGGKSRTAVRKAESIGMRFVHHADLSALEDFYKFYEALTRRNKLRAPTYKLLEKMHREGNLICVACDDGDGKRCIVNVIYLTGRSSYIMYGASDSAAGRIGGHFTHWKTILLLKEMEFDWYDLGGVSDQPEMSGINSFKKSLGGALHDLGAEFTYETPAFALARAALRQLGQ
jgi:Acetyltransferase (GNAT) domain